MTSPKPQALPNEVWVLSPKAIETLRTQQERIVTHVKALEAVQANLHSDIEDLKTHLSRISIAIELAAKTVDLVMVKA